MVLSGLVLSGLVLSCETCFPFPSLPSATRVLHTFPFSPFCLPCLIVKALLSRKQGLSCLVNYKLYAFTMSCQVLSGVVLARLVLSFLDFVLV
jgi:hypothetical protein